MLLVFALCAPAAHAQSAEDQRAAARRLLLEQAQQAAERGDHTLALADAQRAGQLQMTPSLRLFVAREQQALGNVAAAFGAADLCVRDTQRDLTAAHRAEILEQCQTLLEEIRPRVSLLRVQVPDDAPSGTAVRVAGIVLDSALYGVSYPVNPGSLEVVATAPGRQPFRAQHIAEAGREHELTVRFEAEVPREAVSRERTREVPEASFVSRGLGPLVLGAAGLVGFGLGGAFYGLRQSALGDGCTVYDAYVQCASDELRDRAQREAPAWGVAATVSFVAGGALVASGAAWGLATLLRPRATEANHAARVQPVWAPGYVGVRGAL